jgi:hypothetical protein
MQDRTEAVLSLIKPDEEASVALLMVRAEKLACFPSDPHSRNRAIRRAVEQLAKDGLVEIKRVRGGTGSPAILVRTRRQADKPRKHARRPSKTGHFWRADV